MKNDRVPRQARDNSVNVDRKGRLAGILAGTRLHWFDSQEGTEMDTVPAPFTPIQATHLDSGVPCGQAYQQQQQQQQQQQPPQQPQPQQQPCVISMLGKRITIGDTGEDTDVPQARPYVVARKRLYCQDRLRTSIRKRPSFDLCKQVYQSALKHNRCAAARGGKCLTSPLISQCKEWLWCGNICFAPFCTKQTEHLPRQARDKNIGKAEKHVSFYR